MESLLREHGPFLRRLARGLVRDEHVAEDLVHDTWLAALRRPEGPLRDPRGWLNAVLRRRVASHRRTTQLRPGTADTSASDATPNDERRATHAEAEAIALRLERERLVHDAVTRLAEPYRTAIVLRYHEELTPTAIAERTGTPVKTVKTRLARGLEQLRADLARRGEDGGDPARAWLAVVAPLLELERTAPLISASTLSTWLPVTLMQKSLVGLLLVLVGGLCMWQFGAQNGAVAPLSAPEPAKSSLAHLEAPEDTPTIVAPTPELRAREAASTTAAAIEATTEGGLARLEIHITDEAGRPVTGRRVLVEGPRRSGARDEVRHEVTAANGVVTFIDLRPGQYFAHDALAVVEDGRVHVTAGETKVLEWTIRDDVLVRARVVLADGRAAANAELWCTGRPHFTEPFVWRIGVTDGMGALEFRAGRALHVQASLASHVPSERFEIASAPEVEPGVRDLRLVLGAQGAALIGRVVDYAGLPVAGAHVVAGPGGGWQRGDMRGSAPEPPVVATGADGTFAYAAALPPGTHEVAAFADGFAVTTIQVDVPPGGLTAPLEVQLVLVAGGRIVGRVTRPDGTPAPNAELTLAMSDESFLDEIAPRVSAATRSDGTYELGLVPGGSHVLCAESDYREPLARAEARVTVAGETLVVGLTLDDRPALAGRVVDRGGAPVDGVQVRLVTTDGTQYSRGLKTDAAGRFRATCLPKPRPGYESALVRGRDGRRLAPGTWTIDVWSFSSVAQEVHASVDGVTPGTEDLEIVIDRPERASAFVVGRLVAATGQVPEDVVVTLGRENATAAHFVELVRGTGTFRHGPLFPGRYRLEVRREREVIATRSGIDVGADETVDIGVLHLDSGGSVEVALTLVGAEALPAGSEAALLGQASVTLTRDGQRQQWLERTEAGWRSRSALEAGTWRLSGTGEALAFTPRDVVVREGQVTRVEWSATLARAADIRVHLPAARTWSRVRVRATDASGALVLETPFVERTELTTDDFASFEENLPAGTLSVTVETDTQVGLTETVVVPPFPTPFRKVELRLL